MEFCAALVAGILVGRVYGQSVTAYLLLAVLLVLTIFSAMPRKLRPLLLVFLAAGFFGINSVEQAFEPENHIRRFVPVGDANISGTVTTPINHFRQGYRFTLKARTLASVGGKRDVSGLVSVKVYHGKKPPLPGDSLTLRGVRLKPVYGMRNFGGFNYVRYMKDRGIGVRAGLRNEKKIRVEASGSALSPVRLGERVRRYVMRFVELNFPERTAPMAKAMTVAVTGEISPDTRQRFVASGLAHLLAISGLHVGFVSGIAYFILSAGFFIIFLAVRPILLESGAHRKSAALFTLMAVALYVLAAGTKVSALRAGIMAAVYFISAALGREKELLNALAISAIIVLLLNPAALFGPSFLLSYIAVTAIIFLLAWGGEAEEDPLKLAAKKKWLARAGDFVTGTIKISIVVALATAPVVLWFFNKVYLGGIVANVLAVPMAAVAIPSTFLGALLSAVIHPAVGQLAAVPAVAAMDGIGSVTLFFSSFDGFSFESARPPFILAALWYSVLLSFYFRMSVRKYAAVALAVAMVIFNWPRVRQAAEVHFFDVGQGDATLIMFKDGSNLLVDGGPSFGGFDAGRILIKPLRELGVKRLDAVIATHDDSDHIGGLATLIKRMDVKSYYDNGFPVKTEKMAELRRLVEEKNIPYKVLRGGMELPVGDGASIEVLHPTNAFLKKYPNAKDNNFSIAVNIKTNGASVLLTGDMEKKVEKFLLKNSADLSADVLKAPHHGSRTSSTPKFLDAVSPKIAVISAGQFNRFRHPSKEVTRRYVKKGVKLYSTKEQGEIVLRINDGEIDVSSYE